MITKEISLVLIVFLSHSGDVHNGLVTRTWGGLARFLLLGLIWGSSFLWIKISLNGLSPVQITLVRLALGAAVLVVLCLSTGQRLPRDRTIWLRLLVPGLLGNAVPFTLFALGEQVVDSGVAGVLNATTPLWTMLISLVVTDERLGSVRLVGLLVGFAGTVVIFAPWQAAGLGIWGALACVAAAICYGVSATYVGRRLSGTVAPLPLAAGQLTIATGITALAVPFAGRGPVHLAVGPLVAVSILGIAGTGLAFLLFNRMIAEDGATSAAAVTYLTPAVSVLLGALAAGESLNVRVVSGMVVVLAGVALARRKSAAPNAGATGETAGMPLAPTGHPVQTRRRSVAQRDSS